MLDAARTVIAEKGFKHATLDEIAQRAEFGKGTIYNYFPEGKDEMLFAILDDVYADLYAISVETIGSHEEVPFRDRLEDYIASFLGYFLHQRELFVILVKEANRIAFGDEQVKAIYFKDQMDRLVGVMEPVIANAVARGELRDYPADFVAHLILGNVHGYLRHTCLRGIGHGNNSVPGKDEPRHTARVLCDILLNGLAMNGGAEQTPVTSEEIEEDI